MGEADVVHRMPVPGGDDQGAGPPGLGHLSVDARDQGVTAGHGQGAARAEVILHVDHQQCVAAIIVLSDLRHRAPPSRGVGG